MKPAPFDYLRAADLQTALDALNDPSHKVIAGGQSLVPLMALRLARPALLIDVMNVQELRGIATQGDAFVIGAATTQAEVESNRELGSHCPLIPKVVRHIGHPEIRNRGTVGGSMCHADPAAEWPALSIVLDAELTLASIRGTRVIAASDFFLGSFWSALEPDEILVSLRFKQQLPRSGAIVEVARRRGDFALAGVIATALVEGGRLDQPRLVAFGVSNVPLRLDTLETAICGVTLDGPDIQQIVNANLPPLHVFESDIHASPEYRRSLLRYAATKALLKLRKDTGD